MFTLSHFNITYPHIDHEGLCYVRRGNIKVSVKEILLDTELTDFLSISDGNAA